MEAAREFFEYLTSSELQLCKSAQAGRLEEVEAIVNSGENVNQIDKHSWSPLHYAVKSKNLEMTNKLLDLGADVNLATKRETTPIHRACRANSVEIAAALLEAGAHANARDMNDESPLYWAARRGNPELIDLLLNNGGELNLKANNVARKKTPLHAAAKHAHIAAIEVLLARGADPNAREVSGLTPLHNAIFSGSVSAVEAMLKGGADPFSRLYAKESCTPMMMARNKGQRKALKKYGATYTRRVVDVSQPRISLPKAPVEESHRVWVTTGNSARPQSARRFAGPKNVTASPGSARLTSRSPGGSLRRANSDFDFEDSPGTPGGSPVILAQRSSARLSGATPRQDATPGSARPGPFSPSRSGQSASPFTLGQSGPDGGPASRGQARPERRGSFGSTSQSGKALFAEEYDDSGFYAPGTAEDAKPRRIAGFKLRPPEPAAVDDRSSRNTAVVARMPRPLSAGSYLGSAPQFTEAYDDYDEDDHYRAHNNHNAQHHSNSNNSSSSNHHHQHHQQQQQQHNSGSTNTQSDYDDYDVGADNIRGGNSGAAYDDEEDDYGDAGGGGAGGGGGYHYGQESSDYGSDASLEDLGGRAAQM